MADDPEAEAGAPRLRSRADWPGRRAAGREAGRAARRRGGSPQLEAENQRLREPPRPPAGETRLAWVVTYPEISAQPKDDDGEPKGEPIVLKQGETLPADCEWNARSSRSSATSTALQVNGSSAPKTPARGVASRHA
jgi:hypothetical protein